GNVIRVVLPELTEERRKEYVKIVKSKAEDGKVSIRNIRRHAKDVLERIKKDGEAGEDEVTRAISELDDLTKSKVDNVDQLLSQRNAELLDVSRLLRPGPSVAPRFRLPSGSRIPRATPLEPRPPSPGAGICAIRTNRTRPMTRTSPPAPRRPNPMPSRPRRTTVGQAAICRQPSAWGCSSAVWCCAR